MDIRTLPFIRVDDNEAHNQVWGIVLGHHDGRTGDYDKEVVVPDENHPFVLRNTRLWNTFGAFTVQTHYGVTKMEVAHSTYGLEYPLYDTAGQRIGSSEENDEKTYWGGLAFHEVKWPITFGRTRGVKSGSRQGEPRNGSLDTPRPAVLDKKNP